MTEPLPTQLKLLLSEYQMQVLVHDLRGALGTAVGWAELAALDGQTLPDGVTKALSRMQTLLGDVRPLSQVDSLSSVEVLSFVSEHTGLKLEGESIYAEVRPEALGACLRWSAPVTAWVSEESFPAAGGAAEDIRMVKLHLGGLCPLGTELAGFPALERLEEVLGAGVRSLATMLLRAASRGGSGTIRVEKQGQLLLRLRGAG